MRRRLAIDPKTSDRLLAGTGSSRPRNMMEGSGIFYSTNGGSSWSKASGVPDAPVAAIVISPRQPEIAYAAVLTGGVYRSTLLGRVRLAGVALQPRYRHIGQGLHADQRFAQ
jgi:hypothetical protein